MKKQSVVICALLCLITAAAYSNINDLKFINSGYSLDSKYLTQLIEFSLLHDISIETLQNWVMAESSGRERAYNRRSKDYGLCQLHDIDYLVGKYWTGREFNVWNGEHNLFIGLAYLSDLINEFGVYKGFIAYNTGQIRVRTGKILKVGIEYVNRILPIQADAECKLTFIADNFRLVLIFQEQELYDKRGLRV